MVQLIPCTNCATGAPVVHATAQLFHNHHQSQCWCLSIRCSVTITDDSSGRQVTGCALDSLLDCWSHTGLRWTYCKFWILNYDSSGRQVTSSRDCWSCTGLRWTFCKFWIFHQVTGCAWLLFSGDHWRGVILRIFKFFCNWNFSVSNSCKLTKHTAGVISQ